MTRNSAPSARLLVCGRTPTRPVTTGNINSSSASPAWAANPGSARICLRLIDNATKTSPVRAAPTPAWVAKSVCQASIKDRGPETKAVYLATPPVQRAGSLPVRMQPCRRISPVKYYLASPSRSWTNRRSSASWSTTNPMDW